MQAATTIRQGPLEIDIRARAPAGTWRAAARAAWQDWTARRAARALRRRALEYAGSQSSYAEDLAAAAGTTLAELTDPAGRA